MPDLAASEMRWARGVAKRACGRLGVLCDEDFQQSAMVAFWRAKQRSGLSGKLLRRRAYKAVAGSVIDEIRWRLGRRPRGVPRPEFSWDGRRQFAGDFSLQPLSDKEQVGLILAGASPRFLAALEVLLKGGTQREAGKRVGLSESWVCLQLRLLRKKLNEAERK